MNKSIQVKTRKKLACCHASWMMSLWLTDPGGVRDSGLKNPRWVTHRVRTVPMRMKIHAQASDMT
jgi:hypothetical protein